FHFALMKTIPPPPLRPRIVRRGITLSDTKAPRGSIDAHNPQYRRVRLPARHAVRDPEGLRDSDRGRVLRGTTPTPGSFPKHHATLPDLQVETVLRADAERHRALAADRRVRYIQIFKNHGERAGASFSHPHSQVIAIPIVPLRILEEIEGVRAHGAEGDVGCLYCEILRRELETERRIVFENESFVALEPC